MELKGRNEQQTQPNMHSHITHWVPSSVPFDFTHFLSIDKNFISFNHHLEFWNEIDWECILFSLLKCASNQISKFELMDDGPVENPKLQNNGLFSFWNWILFEMEFDSGVPKQSGKP